MGAVILTAYWCGQSCLVMTFRVVIVRLSFRCVQSETGASGIHFSIEMSEWSFKYAHKWVILVREYRFVHSVV